MTLCPQHLHLIWLGSMPVNTTERPHRRRLLEWKELNPDWTVYCWSDRTGREYEQLTAWCEANGLVHRSIFDANAILWGDERTIVYQQIEKGFYANASDLLRLRLLYQLGGVYVDIDVEPQQFPSLELPLGIGLILREANAQLQSVVPHCMAAVQGHTLLQLALWQGVSNFAVQQTIEEDDFRYATEVSQRFGGTLVLTGDLLRPAFRKVFGLLGAGTWGWSPWLEAIQFPISVRHNQEHNWLGEGIAAVEFFFPPTLSMAIAQTWTDQPITSILHWTAEYSPNWMIEIASQQVAPFENYFGHSPKGVAIRAGRSTEVVEKVPSM